MMHGQKNIKLLCYHTVSLKNTECMWL